MEGAAGVALRALGVEGGGYGEGVWVYFDDGAEVGVCL